MSRSWHLHWSLYFWTCISLILSQLNICIARLHNVTISNTSPQIVYTPFLCNASNTDCEGAWKVTQLTDGTNVVSTLGPSSSANNILPQIFLQFRAAALFMTTSPLSNATANITISAGPRQAEVQANTTTGIIAAEGLNETDVTTIVLTYIPDPNGTRLDIGKIALTVTNNPATSSFLPSMTLPPSASLPTFIPTSSSATVPTATETVPGPSSRRTMIAEAVGISVGLGLGLTLLAVLAFLWWKRRRRPRDSFRSGLELQSQIQYNASRNRSPRFVDRFRTRGNDSTQSWF